MTDPRFFASLEQQLLAAERRLAPPRRRWSVRLMRRGVVVPIVIALAGVPALAATQPWDDFAGAPGSHKIQVKAPVPRTETTSVGVISYRTKTGLVCLASGIIKDGRVGRYYRNVFRALDASDAAGQCGDIRQNLLDFGGIALAYGAGSDVSVNEPEKIVYGLVASRSTLVRVTWPDGRTVMAPVTATDSPDDLQGAEGAFAVAVEPGARRGRASVELLRADGTLIHEFEL
jgi:hypothetical protein